MQPPQPLFFFDLASPECYLAAERVNAVLPVVPEWRPVLATGLSGTHVDALRRGAARDAYVAEIERTAAARGLLEVRWPASWRTGGDPAGDPELPMRVATYARQIGRVVAFSLAAFRQAFAGGRDLTDPDNVAIAAAACEMHPTAVLRGAELRSVRDALRASTEEAGDLAVRTLPAVVVGRRVFSGDEELEAAAEASHETTTAAPRRARP